MCYDLAQYQPIDRLLGHVLYVITLSSCLLSTLLPIVFTISLITLAACTQSGVEL